MVISCGNKSSGTPASRSSSCQRYMATFQHMMSIAGNMSSKLWDSMNAPYSVVAVGAGKKVLCHKGECTCGDFWLKVGVWWLFRVGGVAGAALALVKCLIGKMSSKLCASMNIPYLVGTGLAYEETFCGDFWLKERVQWWFGVDALALVRCSICTRSSCSLMNIMPSYIWKPGFLHISQQPPTLSLPAYAMIVQLANLVGPHHNMPGIGKWSHNMVTWA